MKLKATNPMKMLTTALTHNTFTKTGKITDRTAESFPAEEAISVGSESDEALGSESDEALG